MEKLIGAQLYTIRDYTKDRENLMESFKKLSEIGYTYAQASAMDHLAPEDIKEAGEKYNIKITGDHYSFAKMTEDSKAVADLHKIFGCYEPGVGGLPVEARDSKEGILDFMKKANKIADVFAAEGMMFTYHNHAFEFVKVEGKTIMDYILENANKNFKLMVDVYWLSVAGINPVKFLNEHKDMIGGVHYKDLKVVNNGPEICEVGEGNLDWDLIVKTCDDIGVKHIYVEQDRNWTPDPFTSLKTSYENLKKFGYR